MGGVGSLPGFLYLAENIFQKWRQNQGVLIQRNKAEGFLLPSEWNYMRYQGDFFRLKEVIQMEAWN